ncbi:MAG: heavy metal translocating P-type ATPase [Thermodesulfobacteriota bacterium]
MTRTDICDLCGLPLRHGVTTAEFSGHTHRFCCPGCRQVFRMLLEASDSPDPAHFKETELFRKCREMGVIPRDETDLQHRSQGVYVPEDPSTESGAEAPPEDHLLDLTLKVEGMWCPACAWVIDASLRKLDGVVRSTANFSTDILRCRYNPVLTSPDAVIRRIETLGYRAAVFGDEGALPKRKEFIRFCVAALFTMNVMMLSFALYTGFFTRFDMDTIYKLSWPIFVLASIPFFYGGWTIHRRAWSGVFSGAFTMETLISAASAAAYFYSLFNLIYGTLHLYFDTASMLITLTLLGKLLERNAKDRVLSDLEAFFSLKPTKVKIRTDAYPQGRYVSIEMLQSGDEFIADADEIVPADGLILEGRGSVDESSLTGEATPIFKKAGDRMKSGARVLQGRFRVRADAVGADSILGQMISIMEQTLSRKIAVEGRTDVLLQWFVPAILALAAGTGAVGFWLGLSFEAAMIRAITVMVISCPCALGIAIPLARVAGISLAGGNGILVRDFSAFEAAERVDTVVFDKTGTLTQGRYTLQQILPRGPFSEETLLSLALALETESDHPIASEIRRAADRKGLLPLPVQSVTVHENGVSGIWDGKRVRVGAPAFVSEEPVLIESMMEVVAHPIEADASRVYMAVDDHPAGVLIFGDEIREGAFEAVRKLTNKGIELFVVSGDGEETTRAIADQLGIEHHFGDQLPGDKAAFIEQLQQKGRTPAMVGDGINDAPALVQSDLSIAIHSGSHLGKEAASITLMRGDPRQVLSFLNLARRVNRKIHQNLFCSVIYNILAIPIAMSGLLTPVIAVIAMLLSSLTVIGNTLLLMKGPGE